MGEIRVSSYDPSHLGVATHRPNAFESHIFLLLLREYVETVMPHPASPYLPFLKPLASQDTQPQQHPPIPSAQMSRKPTPARRRPRETEHSEDHLIAMTRSCAADKTFLALFGEAYPYLRIAAEII